MTDYSHLPDRALSIRQPWAWAILNAGKDVENRTTSWKFRGRFCIHAALGGSTGERIASKIEILRATNGEAHVPYRHQLQRGGIIGTVELVDIVDDHDSPWFMSGHRGLILRDPQPVPFIPVKGTLGLFKWKERL